MTTVTVEYTNSRNQKRTGTFEIIRRSDITPAERRQLAMDGYEFIDNDGLADDDCARVEKIAAKVAGLRSDEMFYVKMI